MNCVPRLELREDLGSYPYFHTRNFIEIKPRWFFFFFHVQDISDQSFPHLLILCGSQYVSLYFLNPDLLFFHMNSSDKWLVTCPIFCSQYAPCGLSFPKHPFIMFPRHFIWLFSDFGYKYFLSFSLLFNRSAHGI